MQKLATNWFFERLKTDNQCFLYNGNFSDAITSKIIQLSEFNLTNQAEKLKVRKRVSYLMGECFQNIIRHGDKATKVSSITKDPGFFMSRNSEAKYYITSGNLIGNEFIDKLKGQIDQVNNLDQIELKALFKEVMIKGKLSEKGGAGLGLIDMARKSGQKLKYNFKFYDKNSSIFYNQIVLDSEVNDEVKPLSHFDIDYAINFHDKMISEDILMLQKGEFSRNSIIPLLKIIENNLLHEYDNSPIIKKLYHVLVELLQNISRHGYSQSEFKEGIFSVSHNDEKYVISTGNYIENSKIEKLKEHLNKINSLNTDELTELYLHQLKYGDETADGGAGIGLIDIARLLTEKIDYSFAKISDNLSFFTIHVTLLN